MKLIPGLLLDISNGLKQFVLKMVKRSIFYEAEKLAYANLQNEWRKKVEKRCPIRLSLIPTKNMCLDDNFDGMKAILPLFKTAKSVFL